MGVITSQVTNHYVTELLGFHVLHSKPACLQIFYVLIVKKLDIYTLEPYERWNADIIGKVVSAAVPHLTALMKLSDSFR